MTSEQATTDPSGDEPMMRAVPHELDIRAGLDDVWEMLTTGAGLASWFGTAASIDPVVGGDVGIGWGGPEEIMGRVAEIEPTSRLRTSYLNPEDGAELGGEEWLLTHEAGVTHVRLVHTLPDPGVDDWDGFYGDYQRGWTLFLTSLKFALEDAVVPHRRTEADYVPAPNGKPATWEAIAPVVAPFRASMTAAIDDGPNSLLLTDRQRSLLIDLEGSGEGMVCYVQASTHDPALDTAWADAAVAAVRAALT